MRRAAKERQYRWQLGMTAANSSSRERRVQDCLSLILLLYHLPTRTKVRHGEWAAIVLFLRPATYCLLGCFITAVSSFLTFLVPFSFRKILCLLCITVSRASWFSAAPLFIYFLSIPSPYERLVFVSLLGLNSGLGRSTIGNSVSFLYTLLTGSADKGSRSSRGSRSGTVHRH